MGTVDVETLPEWERDETAPAPSDSPSWLTRFDPLTAAVGVVSALVYVLHGFNGVLSRDLAVYAYGGQQVADGEPPYEGIMNRAGPLAHAVPAIGVGLSRAIGFDELLGMRLVFLAVSVACVCLVYVLTRELFASRLAGLAAAAGFLCFHGFIEYASNGPREKTVMVLFFLCALLAMAGRRWLAAGVALSLATLTWQPVFFVGLAAIVVALFAEARGARLRGLIRFAVGGLIPASLCLAYFAAASAFGAFLDGFVVINAEYTASGPFTDDLRGNWSKLWDGYGASIAVLIVGLVALVALSVVVLRRSGLRDATQVPMAACGAAALTGVIWTLKDFDGWPDVFVLLPLAAIGVGGLARELGARLPMRVATAVTLSWVVVAVAVAGTYSLTERSHDLEGQRDSVDAVMGALPPDASILSIEAPEPLVLTGSTNPTRYQMFSNGLDRYVDDTWSGGLTGFAAWIGQQHPTVIAVGRPEPPPWLSGVLATHYRKVGGATCWIWYVDRSVGPAALAAIHAGLPTETAACPEW
jgi:hypothetical protein